MKCNKNELFKLILFEDDDSLNEINARIKICSNYDNWFRKIKNYERIIFSLVFLFNFSGKSKKIRCEKKVKKKL